MLIWPPFNYSAAHQPTYRSSSQTASCQDGTLHLASHPSFLTHLPWSTNLSLFLSTRLLNYTPQASIVRLLAINALNGYLTSWVLYLTGGSADPRLLLPAWICIATTLTALYHITQRKINIRKETSISISVFSIASFISMVSLLAQLHSNRADYPDNIPLTLILRRAWVQTARVAGRLFDLGNATRDL